MRKPTEVFRKIVKPNGCMGRTVKFFSYVAVICEIDGSNVKAVRLDEFERKTDVSKYIDETFPGWKIKLVNRLYDEDFDPPGTEAIEIMRRWKHDGDQQKDRGSEAVRS